MDNKFRQKYMIKKITKKIFSAFGLNVSRTQLNGENFDMSQKHPNSEANPFVAFEYPIEGFEAVKLTTGYSMLPPINLYTLFEQAVYCEKKQIKGAFVECGVWKGGAVGIMAKANLQFGSSRRQLYLFDAFDNICPPDAEVDGNKAIKDTKEILGLSDIKEMTGQLESIEGGYDSLGGHGTIQICKDLLERIINYPSKYIHFKKGWFQDTLPIAKDEINAIAILRLDGDWYASIKVCLENLYDKVSQGGLVVIDDYGYYEGCTKAVDEFLEERNIKTFLSYSSPNCRYFVKP